MKIAILLTVIILFACNNNKETQKPERKKRVALATCYSYETEKDTVILRLMGRGENVAGTLIYQLHEKDKNTGTFRGEIKNGILFADYTFMSEGVTSKRSVAFKVEGDRLIEGSGDMKLEGDQMQFVKPDSLNYSGGILLQKTDCNK